MEVLDTKTIETNIGSSTIEYIINSDGTTW